MGAGKHRTIPKDLTLRQVRVIFLGFTATPIVVMFFVAGGGGDKALIFFTTFFAFMGGEAYWDITTRIQQEDSQKAGTTRR